MVLGGPGAWGEREREWGAIGVESVCAWAGVDFPEKSRVRKEKRRCDIEKRKEMKGKGVGKSRSLYRRAGQGQKIEDYQKLQWLAKSGYQSGLGSRMRGGGKYINRKKRERERSTGGEKRTPW